MINLPMHDEGLPRVIPENAIDLKSERASVRNAKWTILHDGFLLPVTNLFDTDGNEIQNPMLAATVIAFNEHVASDKWFSIPINPGELWSRHHAEVPGQGGTGRDRSRTD